MAHNAMPSNKQIKLTLGISGSTYIAPTDGYIHISMLHDNTPGGRLQVVVHTGSLNYDCSVDNIAYGASLLVPVPGQSTIEINYTVNSSAHDFSFIYAYGTSETN
jgi:hypothetical protein